MQKKRHHFIPVFYLEGFVDPYDQTHLWIYDKDCGEIRDASPRDAGLQKHFYSFTTPEGERDSVSFENALAQIEGQVATSWRKIINREAIDDADREIISSFLSLMMTRVPVYRHNIERLDAALVKSAASFLASQGVLLAKIRAEYEREGRKPPNNLEDIVKRFLGGEYEVEVEPQVSLTEVTTEFSLIFSEMNWTYFITKGKYPFVTSDNPLSYIDPTHDARSPYGVGLINANIEVTFPVSRDIALVATWKRLGKTYQKGTDRLVKEINYRTIMAASRFVYSSQRSDGFNRLVHRYRGSEPKIVVN